MACATRVNECKLYVTFAIAQALPHGGFGALFRNCVWGDALIFDHWELEEKGIIMDIQLDKADAAKRRHNSKAYLSGIGLATMMISPASAAQVTPASVNGFEHFVDCFKVMLNAPPVHAANCDPGQAGPTGSLTSFSGGAAPIDCEINFNNEC
jgi:hypothetical protein